MTTSPDRQPSVPPADVAAALVAARKFSPFFETVPPSASSWRPAELPPEVVTGLIDKGMSRLITDEPRVALASIQFGLAARVTSVLLGTWLTANIIPDLSGWQLQVDDEYRFALALEPPAGFDVAGVGDHDTATIIIDQLRNALDPLHDALTTVARCAPRLLWGNVGSALVGSAGSITRYTANPGTPPLPATAHTKPELATLLAALLDQQPLRNTMTGTWPAEMARNTCCLYYRGKISEGRTCGGCPVKT